MPARLLLEVAIRVLGLWSLYSAVSSLAQIAGMTLSTIGMVGPPTRWLFVGQIVVPFVVQCLFGAVLVWWAPWIAARFYPVQANEAEIRLSVGPGDVYRVACFILGVYLLLTAVHVGSQFVASTPGALFSDWGRTVGDGIAMLASATTGIVLVFGSERIGRLLSNLRYDPNTIPKQQFSLRVLLGLMLLAAAVIGAIRLLTVGIP